MDDVIYRRDAVDALKLKGSPYLFGMTDKDRAIEEAIKNVPSAQKKGEWLYDEEREATGIYAICSCCSEKVYQCGEWLFCPRCGADMRGEDDG